jgi:hypothetical protein
MLTFLPERVGIVIGMASDQIEFGSKDADDVEQGFDQASVGSHNVVQIPVRGRLEFAVCQSERRFVLQGVVDSLDGVARVISRLRHEAEPNRSGGEGQGPFSGEPASQLGKDRQVGVESDPIQSPDAERE